MFKITQSEMSGDAIQTRTLDFPVVSWEAVSKSNITVAQCPLREIPFSYSCFKVTIHMTGIGNSKNILLLFISSLAHVWRHMGESPVPGLTEAAAET